VRTVTAAMLRDLGYRVQDVATGEAALTALADDDAIQIVMTDVVMSGMNGIQLAAAALAAHPDLSVLFISGYMDQIGGTLPREHRLLQNPFSAADLYHAIEAEVKERGAVLSRA
jgi:CheY-like chemotaxis protein